MTLKVVEPIDITEAALTASDIPEPDASAGEVEWEVGGRKAKFALQPLALDTIKPYGSAALFGAATSDDRATFLCVDSLTPDAGVPSDAFYVISRDKQGNIAGYAWNDYFTNSEFNSIFRVSDGVLGYVGVASVNFSGFIAGNLYYIESAQGDTFPLNESSYLSLANSSQISGRSKALCSGAYLDEVACALDDSSSTYQSKFYLVRRAKPGVHRQDLVLKFPDSSYQNICKIFELSGKPAFAFSGDDGIKVYTYSSDLQFDTPPTLEYEIKFDSSVAPFTANAYITESTTGYAVDTELFYTLNLPSGQGTVYDGYIPGDTAVLADEHKKYQCLRATTESPLIGATDDATATWIEAGPTNKWAMFDNQNSTTTKSSESFSVELESSDYIMAYGAIGSSGLTSVRCQVYDSGSNLIYDDTQSAFDNVGAPGDFIYASEDVFYKKKLYQTDIPPTENFKAVFTFNGSDIEIGNLTVGPAIELGPCLSESKNESLDLSEQVFDSFGYETYTERPIITFATYETISSIESSNIINRFLNVIRRKGCLWIGEVGYNQSIVTFGRIERDPIPYTMPTEIRYTIRVRGFA